MSTQEALVIICSCLFVVISVLLHRSKTEDQSSRSKGYQTQTLKKTMQRQHRSSVSAFPLIKNRRSIIARQMLLKTATPQFKTITQRQNNKAHPLDLAGKNSSKDACQDACVACALSVSAGRSHPARVMEEWLTGSKRSFLRMHNNCLVG